MGFVTTPRAVNHHLSIPCTNEIKGRTHGLGLFSVGGEQHERHDGRLSLLCACCLGPGPGQLHLTEDRVVWTVSCALAIKGGQKTAEACRLFSLLSFPFLFFVSSARKLLFTPLSPAHSTHPTLSLVLSAHLFIVHNQSLSLIADPPLSSASCWPTSSTPLTHTSSIFFLLCGVVLIVIHLRL